MEAKVVWREGLRFAGSAEGSGFSLALDADPAAGGGGDGFRPLELLLVGLAGCTAMDVASILAKKRQEVRAFEVRVHAERAAEHPKVFTDVALEYVVTGRDIDPGAVERAVQLSEETYCAAQAMLRPHVRMTRRITIVPA